MHHSTKAVIFDMDGVIINSEPLWRKSMVKAFVESGIPFTEDDCRKTTGMRIYEVIEYWQKFYPKEIHSINELKHRITHYLIDLINNEGKGIDGLHDLLDFLQTNKIKIGLATSSDQVLLDAVMNKLNIKHYFQSTISAQELTYGKPHPEVYLKCSEHLAINPLDCLVIEDSVNGMISGLAAQMRVLAFPDQEHINNVKFKAADGLIGNLSQVKDFLILN